MRDRLFNIYVASSRKDVVYKGYELPFSKFVKRLEKSSYTDECYEDYLKMEKSLQDDVKDVGGFVGGSLKDGKRRKDSVLSRSLITLDVDFGYRGMWDFITMTADYCLAMYTTHKHSKDNERFRLVIPTSRDLSPLEYEAVARMVASDIGIDYFDDSTYEPSRLMYFPSTSKDGEFRFDYLKDDFLDVDEYLARYEDYTDTSSWPVSSRVDKIEVCDKDKQQNPLEKDGVIGAFCRTYDIHQAINKYLGDVYESTTDPNRYTYINGSTCGGLVVYEDGLFAYSHHSSDPCFSKMCNAYDLVKNHKFKDVEEDKSYALMLEMLIEDEEVMKRLGEEKIETAKSEFSEIYEEVEVDNNENKNTSDNGFITRLEVDKNGRYKNTINNIVIILENDPILKGKIALNEFSHQITIKENLPWIKIKNKKYGDIWTDADDSNLRHYLEKAYNIKSQQAIFDAITVVARKNTFHPIKDYLNSTTWDKTPRVDKLFINYLGAENNEYTKAVCRKMLTAAVARIFNPGVKFDYMAVFVGPQGIGKSHLINLLGRDWYSDSINTVQGKEAYEQLQEAWIVEMAELTATKKAESEAVKHFISKREDIYRVAYGRRVEKFPRQCVFFGTTNEVEFLKDRTGNRRFWPVKVGVSKIRKSMFKDLDENEIKQIWAEAVEIYKGGEKLILEGKILKTAVENQEMHLDISPKEGMIREYLKVLLPPSWDDMDISARRRYISGGDFSDFEKGTEKRTRICAMEIWVELFNGDPKQLSPMQSREINGILRKIPNWNPHQKGSGKLKFGKLYGYQKAFVLTENDELEV
ncbi:VapE domain-containing protein [Paraclostridium bifermentans]|uniref:VapE domain-containing protein n=1 Tax=Paraclostridium bifermentans TaxID=1490 RepID=UPI00359C7D97